MTVDEALDFSARYTHAGWGAGVAWRLEGYRLDVVECGGHFAFEDVVNEHGAEYPPDYVFECDGTCEPDVVENREWVRAVMVGDDTVFLLEVTELTKLDDDAYCTECGQVGCKGDGRG